MFEGSLVKIEFSDPDKQGWDGCECNGPASKPGFRVAKWGFRTAAVESFIRKDFSGRIPNCTIITKVGKVRARWHTTFFFSPPGEGEAGAISQCEQCSLVDNFFDEFSENITT